MKKSENFKTVDLGTTYNLPKYRIVDGKGIEPLVTNDEFKLSNIILSAEKLTIELDSSGIVVINEKGGVERELTLIDKTNWRKEVIDRLFKEIKNNDKQEITFVRGDKTDNGQVIPRVDGITHEQLLGMMITDLEYKHSIIPSKESEEAIKNLKLALFWLEERQREREKRNVQGTYQK